MDLYYIHFSELIKYKWAIYEAGLKLYGNNAFNNKAQHDWLVYNYFRDSTLPQVLVDAVNDILQRRGIPTPLDDFNMSILISKVVYEGWNHIYENWEDYFVLDNCIVNDKPFVFKNTHPSLQDLVSFDSEFARNCYDITGEDVDQKEFGCMIINVLARYLMGDVFDIFFNGNADYLPPYINKRLKCDAEFKYLNLKYSALTNPSIINTYFQQGWYHDGST